MKHIKKAIAEWEKGEHIISQKVFKLPHGKYLHMEEVTYPKHKKRR